MRGSPVAHEAQPVVSGKTVLVSFEPFVALDWKAKAVAALKWLKVDGPSAPQIALLKIRLPDPKDLGSDPDTAELRFQSSLDPLAARGTFFFAGVDGVFALKPVDLTGFAKYKLDAGRGQVIEKTFQGVVNGLTPGHKLDEYEGGGFVLFSSSPVQRGVKTPAAAGLLQRLDRAGIPIRVAYTFPFAGSTYLFVHWGVHHDSICGFEAGLYLVPAQADASPTEVEATAYGCDAA